MSGADGAAFRRPTAAPTIRVALGGAQLLLDAAAAGLVGDGVTHLRLLYDRDTRRVGLMPTHATDPDGFPLGHAADGRSMQVKAFVDRYRIPVGERFPLEREGDLFVARIPADIPDGYVNNDADEPRLSPRPPEA